MMHRILSFKAVFVVVVLSLVACGNQTAPEPPPLSVSEPVSEAIDVSDSYPDPIASVRNSESAYPVLSDTENDRADNPPDPQFELPENSSPEVASIGGVLIQEFLEDNTYIPLNPSNIFLGSVLEDQSGLQTHIVIDSNAVEAQLLNTGVFVFSNVVPGSYGLIIDLGFTQFIMKDEQGNPLILNLKAGDAIDLGQLFVSNEDF